MEIIKNPHVAREQKPSFQPGNAGPRILEGNLELIEDYGSEAAYKVFLQGKEIKDLRGVPIPVLQGPAPVSMPFTAQVGHCRSLEGGNFVCGALIRSSNTKLDLQALEDAEFNFEYNPDTNTVIGSHAD